MLKLHEPFRDYEVFINLLFDLRATFFNKLWLIRCSLDLDPWIQRAKILLIQQIQILGQHFGAWGASLKINMFCTFILLGISN